MKNELTKIVLHGILGKKLKRKEWDLKVSSVKEALVAINVNTDFKLTRCLTDLNRENVDYKILINKKIPVQGGGENDQDQPILMNYKNLKRIDIVPVIRGAFLGGWFDIVLGGMILYGSNNDTMKLVGTTLLFTGVSEVLSDPPEAPDQRQMENPSSDPTQLANSYLFNGPVNVLNEGGPVPVGYGRLIVGSQVVMSVYDVDKLLTTNAGRVI